MSETTPEQDEARLLALIKETDERGDGEPRWYIREFNEAVAIGNRWYRAQPWWRRWWIDVTGWIRHVFGDYP